MHKMHFHLLIIFFITSSSGVLAQITPELILPDELNGEIKLKTSLSTINDNGKSVYDKLAVFVKNKSDNYETNPIHGNHKEVDSFLIFKPFYPFEKRIQYVVRIRDDNSNSNYSFTSFQIGIKEIDEEAKVLNIFPSASQLPENLLRFYIYFNTPMKKGQALKYIKLIDRNGNVDNHAFMGFKQELWSSDGTRLTLLFDPGRIKRGVSGNMSSGPALIEGNHYKLSISGEWQDVNGQQLTSNTTKEFLVDKGYRHKIKTSDWRLEIPNLNSRDTLILNFNRIMDHALIQSMITLKNIENNDIEGFWEILENEQQIRFISERKWQKGNYQIIIDSRLEDVAGNNLQNLLDHNKTDVNNSNSAHQIIRFEL